MAELLDRLRGAAPPGWLALPELGVRVPGGNLIPDIAVLRPGVDLDAVWFEPADVGLIVEVASPSTVTIDRGSKALKYAEAGIPAYWCVDRDGTLVVCRLAAGSCLP